MAVEATGKIRIEGDTTKFNGSVKDVKDGLKDIEKSGISIGESFSTTMNQSLELFSKIKEMASSVFNHIKEQGEKAAMVERRDIAYTMLKRSNREYYELAKNVEQYTSGLMRSNEAVFLMNKAVTRNFNLTKTQMQEILQISSKIAVSQGMEINDVFDKISESVAKGEMAPLEELGYIDLLEEKVEEYAKKLNKTTNEIDRQAKSEIVLSEIRKQNAEGLIGTVSQKEFDIKMQLNKNLAEITKSNENFDEAYNKFWADNLNKIGAFIRDKNNIEKIQRAKEKEILEKDLGGKYKTWADYMVSQQRIVDRGGKSFATYTNEYTRNMEKIKGSVIDFQKSMESKAAFNIFYIGLQKMKYELKPITDEFVKLKNSIWFLKDKPVEEKPIIDNSKLKNEIDVAKSQLLSLYDTINKQEFNTFQDKEEWDKRRSNYEKSLNKKKLSELKLMINEENKVLFGKERTEKDIANFEYQLSEYDNMIKQAVSETDAAANEVKKQNAELFASINKDIMDENKKTFMESQLTLDNLNISYNNELDRFREYAKEKKLTAQQLASGLLQIDKRYNENKKRINKDEFDGVKQTKNMLKDMVISTTQAMYSALISSEEDALQRTLANSLISAGGNIWAKGVENVWIGVGEMISTFGIKGGEQAAFGGLQMAAGLGMGYIGKAALPSSSSSIKEESSKIDNQISNASRKKADETPIYLFPSQREWIEVVNNANKKIRK